MVRVSRKVGDKRLLALIGRYLPAGVMVDTELPPSTEGTMHGRSAFAVAGEHPAGRFRQRVGIPRPLGGVGSGPRPAVEASRGGPFPRSLALRATVLPNAPAPVLAAGHAFPVDG